jgi:hypothetical protein
MLVWSAYQLQQWRVRMASERGEPAPPENTNLKLARDALEHLCEARFDEDTAVSPGEKAAGRALRDFPEQKLGLYLGGRTLFDVLDPQTLDEEAVGRSRASSTSGRSSTLWISRRSVDRWQPIRTRIECMSDLLPDLPRLRTLDARSGSSSVGPSTGRPRRTGSWRWASAGGR